MTLAGGVAAKLAKPSPIAAAVLNRPKLSAPVARILLGDPITELDQLPSEPIEYYLELRPTVAPCG